ncbi:MAG: hypothetical protein A3E25_19715 [Burkholderiales bacterium RIFCSPHIGHO2_12_FULL_69_20]|nr:MAG: hypothetical protein A3E25_19715 [Burkholderiales bacterium RIFCSPHIGHO2_12_FULL_69_20]
MTLTVRLDAALQAALDRHCAEHGVTKTLVVQECLATYLVAARPGPAARQADAAAEPSASYRAFADAGLIGAVATGGTPADKAAVRRQVLRRLGKGVDAA